MDITSANKDPLQMYLNSIQDNAILSFEKEQELARDWINNGNHESAHELANSYLRLVVKLALGFKGYGLPINEMIQEGNIGLMQAIDKFDPDKGFRLSTYAVWWIKAAIQEYVLASWSLVKIGTTAAQKKLFFNLRKLRNKIKDRDIDTHLNDKEIAKIAKKLDVKKEEVISMSQRMFGNDQSLNAIMNDEVGDEWQDMLVDDTENQEELYSRRQEQASRKNALHTALEQLNEREREIVVCRNIQEKKVTLDDLSKKFGVSRERIRQLEEKAIKTVKGIMTKAVAV